MARKFAKLREGQELSQGKTVELHNREFIITGMDAEVLKLESKPLFKRDQKKNVEIEWDEVVDFFEQGKLKIEGFGESNVTELSLLVEVIVNSFEIESLAEKTEAFNNEKTSFDNELAELRIKAGKLDLIEMAEREGAEIKAKKEKLISDYNERIELLSEMKSQAKRKKERDSIQLQIDLIEEMKKETLNS